mgnify:CR=1 FL=1
MKKSILSLLAVASLSFGFENYEEFVKNYTKVITNTPNLYVGSIIDGYTKAVVGFAGCDNNGYYFKFNVINTYTGYKDAITVYPDIPGKSEACKVINTADKFTTVNQVNVNGQPYEFGSVEYNGGIDCVSEFIDVTDTKTNTTIPVLNNVCFGIDPFNPLKEKGWLMKFNGKDINKYLNFNHDAIMTWNKKNSDKTNALWLDKDKEDRYAYSTKEIEDLAMKANVIGMEVDQDGVLLYLLGVANDDSPALFIGDKTIAITDEMLNKAPKLKAAYETLKQAGDNTRYFIGCEDSASLANGSDNLPTGYVYRVFNKVAYGKYPIVNSNAKGISPYLCDASNKGKEINKEQFNKLVNAGILLSKPVVIDDNKTPDIEDEEDVADEVVKLVSNPNKVTTVNKPEVPADNSPKGKIIALLKSVDMPGDKIDEKGRYLGEVMATGEGTVYITLPNDEEIDVSIDPNSSLNKLGIEYKASLKEQDTIVYAYGCDIPTMEVYDKNVPEIGVIYTIYNGKAIRSMPAFIKGSFKCIPSMVNKIFTADEYYKQMEKSINNFKAHPAVAR